MSGISIRSSFLAGAEVVLSAVSDERTAYMWEEPSVLEGQNVGSLAGHLARGSVWVVEDYLDGAEPLSPHDGGVKDFGSAAEYIAHCVSILDDEANASIRDRGAAVASEGPKKVALKLEERVESLSGRLTLESSERLVSVYGGKVMTLDDYLITRMVEQAVHLVDLNDSLDLDADQGWSYPGDAAEIVVRCGFELSLMSKSHTDVVRAMFRQDAASVFPVM